MRIEVTWPSETKRTHAHTPICKSYNIDHQWNLRNMLPHSKALRYRQMDKGNRSGKVSPKGELPAQQPYPCIDPVRVVDGRLATSWSIQKTEKEWREDEVLGNGLETHHLPLHQSGKFSGEAHLPLLIISSNLSSPTFKRGSHPPGCESHSKALLTLEPPVLWSGALSAWPQALCPPDRCGTGVRLLPPPRWELSLCVAAQVASDHSCKNDDEIEF